jgi:UDP:flavonoid glycosyltransferase YjiC (YdhE family)
MRGSEGHRITLVTSNGWGLGHLSRQLAVALAVEPGSDLTMFSMSRGLPLIEPFGIRGEYCPGPDTRWIVRAEWDSYVRDRFVAFLEETSPDVVLFDGVAPYLGILRALRLYPAVSTGWLRRGMWQNGPNDAQLRKETYFDFVVEPGDLASDADSGPTAGLDAHRIPAISLLDVIEPLSRTEACARLGLDPDGRTLLVTLGSGQPGESSRAAVSAVTTALANPEWQVAVARSPIAAPDSSSPRPGTIALPGVYPLAQYLSAFDAAVGAAGYNSVHEWLHAGVPSLLVPKSASKTDNQVERARFLSQQGLVLDADDRSPDLVDEQLELLLDDDVRMELRSARERLDVAHSFGGAQAVARFISDPPAKPPVDQPSPVAKERFKSFIGPRAVDTIRRIRGHKPLRSKKARVSLTGDSRSDAVPLALTSDPSQIVFSDDSPIEHLLAESSSTYRDLRRRIITDYYEVVD